ncbi:MAG TPA: thrombospondin type 3 repeat-containing protein [Verrucomicrobiales bacterium]|nr:thrombospondin type 3 repeat-containing protein [Verrucomicrobiales bacterium]
MTSWMAAGAGLGEVGGSEFQLQFGAYGLPGLQPGRSIGVLVADTAGDGFAGLETDPAGGSAVLALLPRREGGMLGDDLVLMVLQAVDVGGITAFESPGSVAFETGDPIWEGILAPGQRLGLYYFTEGGSDPGFPYRFYRSDEVTDAELGGDHPYRVPGPGASVIVLSAAESAGGSLPETAFLDIGGIVGEGGTTYDQWRDSVFGTGDHWDEAERSPRGDPDGDGQNNAAEYAAGSDPLRPSPAPLEVVRDKSGGWNLLYRQAGDRSDVLQYLEWSQEGRMWFRADETGSGEGPRFRVRVSPDAGGLGVEVEVEVDDGPATGAWFRLRSQTRTGP